MYEPEPVGEFKDFNELARFLENEFRRISVSMNDVYGGVQVLHNAPNKPREGMIRIADGSDWDPGSGGGLYVYRDGEWKKQADGQVTGLNEQAGDYTLKTSDTGKVVSLTSSSDATFTVPGNTFSENVLVHFEQQNTGQITIVGDGTATVRVWDMFNPKTGGQFAMATLWFRDANNPRLTGQLELA